MSDELTPEEVVRLYDMMELTAETARIMAVDMDDTVSSDAGGAQPSFTVEIGPAIIEQPTPTNQQPSPSTVAFASWEPRGPLIHADQDIRLGRQSWYRWVSGPELSVAGLTGGIRTIPGGALIVEEEPDSAGQAYIWYFLGAPQPEDSRGLVLPGDVVLRTRNLTFVIGATRSDYRARNGRHLGRVEYSTLLSLEPGAHGDVRIGNLS